jgi:flagellar hook-associated protein 1 FlgK
VLSAAATVADAVRLQAHHLADEASDQRAHTLSTVDEVNTVTTQLAATNKTIAAAHTGGTDTTDLLDERDALALRLAELTGATSTIRADGGMDVDLNGLSLVSGSSSAQLQIAGGVAADGSAAPSPLTFALLPAGGGPAVAVSGALGGDLGATAELLNVSLPTYAAGLALVAQNLAESVNTQHALGFDRSGAPGGPLFGYDPTDAAGSLDVVITDPSKLAASSVASASLDAGNAGPLADAVNVDDQYQRLVNTFGSTVASAQRLAKNQGAMTAQVDSAREQLVGVSLDEETVNMLAAQRAYESAARVMTTVDSVLDTLINRTGLVR